MGMLQLAGAISGFGKGMGEGLQTMQNTMSQAMLQEERNKSELLRLRETFGHDRGILKEQQVFAVKQANLAHSRALDIEDQRQDFEAGQKRITREADRQKVLKGAELDKELEALKNKYEIEMVALKEGLSRQAAARKVKEDQAEKERDRKDKERERQHMTGERIVLKGMELQEAKERGRAGSAKEDYHGQDAKVKAIESTLKMRFAELESLSLTPEREVTIRKEIAALERERNALLGIEGGYPAPASPKVDVGRLDTFKGRSPLSSPAPKTTVQPPAEPNLPRFGNTEPTLDQLRAFQRDYEAAEKTGGKLSVVVEAFQKTFGRLPSKADWDRLRNARR